MDLISKEDAVALITAEMDKIRTHSLVDGTARINLRLAKNIIEDMPSIDLADYVPKDFHDKTCEAMAKRHQEEVAGMVSVVRCKECKKARQRLNYLEYRKENYAAVLETNRRCMAKRREEREMEKHPPKPDTIVAIGYAERQMADTLRKAGKVRTEL